MVEQNSVALSLTATVPIGLAAYTLTFAAITFQLMRTGERDLRSVGQFSLIITFHYLLLVIILVAVPDKEQIAFGLPTAIASTLFPFLRLFAIWKLFELKTRRAVPVCFVLSSIVLQFLPLFDLTSKFFFYTAIFLPDLISSSLVCLILISQKSQKSFFGAWMSVFMLGVFLIFEALYFPLMNLLEEQLLSDIYLSLSVLEVTALLTVTFGYLVGKFKLMATTDALTELSNRRMFTEKSTDLIKLSRRYNHPFAIMIFDIDYFKRINDTFGHAAGDEALRAFATVLRNHTREVDVLSRLGGEEFGILMPETDLPEALHAAERLRQAVESVKVNFKTNQISMTTSIGIATLHESDEELHTLLSRADQSLYQAKAMGRNQVVASEF